MLIIICIEFNQFRLCLCAQKFVKLHFFSNKFIIFFKLNAYFFLFFVLFARILEFLIA
jgi:hypothetical protein